MYRWLVLLTVFFQLASGFTGRGLYYPGRSDLFELSVLHINDFHARFEQTSPKSGPCRKAQEPDCVGGLARVSTAVKRLLDERPNPVFLNAGDHYQGTLWYNVHRWNATAAFMNMLPHDAMTIGNHEFDNKIEGLVPFLKAVKAPVVVTNIDDSEEPSLKGLYKNSTIIDRNGVKIGVIGVILSTTNTIANTEKLKFLGEVESVNDEANRLKEKGVDIIIVLSHCGLDRDRIMAENCPLIDLIVGGHSHTFLYSGPPPFIDRPEDEYPVVVNQGKENRTVLIVQAAAYTKYLGNLTVWFDKDGEIVDWDGNPILLDYSIEQDPEILRALEPWKAVVDEKATAKIGSTKVLLDSRCRRQECNLGNLIVDAMVDAFVEKAENKSYWSYAAVACTNPGGVRTSIDVPDQTITYGDLMTAQPFENTWDTIEIKGSCIREILNTQSPLVWSGLKITYNASNANQRLVDVKIRCRACQVPRYEKLIDEEWYRMVIASFLVTGGDGYKLFKTCSRNHRVGIRDTDSLIEYIGKMSPVTAGTDRRLTFIGRPPSAHNSYGIF